MKIRPNQATCLSQAYLERNVQALETFMLSTHAPRFLAANPNARRLLVLRAIQRAAAYGCTTVQDAGKVLLLMVVQGENFDLLPPQKGGLFNGPDKIDAAALDQAVQHLLDQPTLAWNPGSGA